MRVLLVAVLGVASPAAAQPVSHANGCIVTITRAPDDVRATIDAWVEAEPRCETALDVKVVPTVDGLYLIARSPDGKVRERIVPDVQSAAVLVASWAAESNPRSSWQIESTPRDVAPTAVSHSASKWLTLGGMMMIGGSGGYGLRGDLDLLTRGSWSLGVGVGGSQTNDDVEGDGWIKLVDLRVVATLAGSMDFGAWQVRLAAGAGVVHTELRGVVKDYGDPMPEFMEETGHGDWLTAEGSLLISRRFGDWALAAGPSVGWMAQRKVNGNPGEFDRTLEVTAFAGIRRKL